MNFPGRLWNRAGVGFALRYRSRVSWIAILLGFVLQGCAEEAKRVRTPAVELFQQGFIAYEDEFYQDAEKRFQTLTEEHPNTRLATLAYLKMGDLNYMRGKWEDAESNYRMFLNLSPQSLLTPYVLNRLIALNYERNKYGIFFKGREYDRNMEPNRTILKEYQRFFLLFPKSPYLEEVKEYLLKARADLAEHEFAVGNFYFKRKAYHSAIARYLYLMKYYPEFPGVVEVAERLIEAYNRNQQPALAAEMKSVLESMRQRDLLPQTSENWQ